MSATPPLTTIQVATATYFHLECSHTQLFHSEYKRCFPHCCPEHIDRSYCGSSLSLRVDLEDTSSDAAPTDPQPSDILAVFARFEAANDVSLQPRQYVEVDKIAANTQSDNNLDGQWVAGTLDRPSSLVTVIRPPGMPSDSKKPLVFHLNGKPFSRWYYDWESGANKAQRLMKHVFKTYIVERCAVGQDGNFTAYTSHQAFTQLYRVLHVVSSAEFTVISYRRARIDQMQTIQTQVYQVVNMSEPDANRKRLSYSCSSGRRVVLPLEDKLFWEHSNASIVTFSKNLDLLVAFIRWAPLGIYGDELPHLVEQKLIDSLSTGSTRTEKVNCFSHLLLQHTRSQDQFRAATGGGCMISLELETLLQVGSQAILWLFSRETRDWIRRFFHQNAALVLDKTAIRACFLQFLRELEDHLNAQVLAFTPLRNLSNVAEEVIAAVYSHECFHDRRPFVRQILSGQNFSGWSLFVAQMRETYISSSSLSSKLQSPERNTFATAFPPQNSVERDWNGEWLLDMQDSEWYINEVTPPSGRKSRAGPSLPDVSLFSLVEFVSQIARLEVAIDVWESSLRVRSPLGLAGDLDCMYVVLDKKDRFFRMAPNGIASCGGDGAYGDYVGEMRVEGPGHLIIFSEFFNWSLEEGSPSYHVRTCMECHRNGRLTVDGDILTTTGLSPFTTEEFPYVGEMTLRAKQKSIEKASARRYYAAGAPSGLPAAPWREYGRFHLEYQKV